MVERFPDPDHGVIKRVRLGPKGKVWAAEVKRVAVGDRSPLGDAARLEEDEVAARAARGARGDRRSGAARSGRFASQSCAKLRSEPWQVPRRRLQQAASAARPRQTCRSATPSSMRVEPRSLGAQSPSRAVLTASGPGRLSKCASNEVCTARFSPIFAEIAIFMLTRVSLNALPSCAGRQRLVVEVRQHLERRVEIRRPRSSWPCGRGTRGPSESRPDRRRRDPRARSRSRARRRSPPSWILYKLPAVAELAAEHGLLAGGQVARGERGDEQRVELA